MPGRADRTVPIRVVDPQAVAVVTHPLRMRLLGELSGRGAARVTDLADAVGEPANSVSFHLRRLARYGFIEEDPGHGQDGRERWWRMTSDRGFELDLDAMREHPGGAAAASWLRHVAEAHVVALHRAVTLTRDGTADPAPARTISDDFALRLSDSEVEELRDEVSALLDRWGARSRSLAAADDGEQRRAYYGVVLGALVDEISAVSAAAATARSTRGLRQPRRRS